ncbi:FxSxx-COOH system tetratricopeptide repeat protein [Streptomyces sp. NPDC001270]|uniref:FxSxx-COOH system tetratricopeptide repeat protein n=1 Tax=Streptomyces sp. NPDC001270 TaxID=3364554 RepID=UPI003679E814
MDERPPGDDHALSGDLLPPDDTVGAVSVSIGLRPIADDVLGERRDLALALRRCFEVLDISVRRYAVTRRYHASSVSRYLSGDTVAPDNFIATLMDDVGRKLGRPMAQEARLRVTGLQRAALKATSSRAWKVQYLEDQLVTALHEKDLARTQADAVATALQQSQEHVARLEAERAELTRTASDHQLIGVELDLLRAEQHRERTERDALHQRVADLEKALEAAERRVARAEQRCVDLEHQLLAADATAADEEHRDRRQAEENREREQAELDALREEVARLRAATPGTRTPEGTTGRDGTTTTAAATTGSDPTAATDTTTETETETGAHRAPTPRGDLVATGAAGSPTAVRRDFTAAPSSVTIVFSGANRPWAAWIAQCLERHGHRITLQHWDPPHQVPLEDSLGDLLRSSVRVLLVLNDGFFEIGPRPAGEWDAVLRGFVAAHSDRFAAVSLTNRALPPATAVLEPAGLWGLSEEEAEDRLLSRLGLERARTQRALTRYPETNCEVWGEVPRRNPRFTGRDHLLTDIHQRLADAERGAAACTLLGMSGVGKTQLAAEYAHRFNTAYDLVWWVNSDDRAGQRDRLGELAVKLGLPVGGEPEERIRAVRDALRRGHPYANWLVVFDGWDDTEGVGALLPEGSGHILVTSRNRTWGDHMDVVEIPAFLRAESTAYLMRRAPQLTSAEADEVAAEFGDVPLPLVQAAAWLGESGMDASEYLRMVRERRLSTVDEPGTGDGFPQSSMTSWSILLNRLRRTEPRALDVLGLCTAFAPGPIPLGLVHAYPGTDLPEELRWMTDDLPAWTHALDTLVTYSVLTRGHPGDPAGAEADPSGETVHMHRLVHDIVSKLIDGNGNGNGHSHGDGRADYRRAVRTLLAAADPGNPEDSRNWPRYADLLPHLEPSGALGSDRNPVQRTVLNCLRYSLLGGDHRAGLALARQVRTRWSTTMDPLTEPMLDLADQESALLQAGGRFREAYELARGVLERLEAAPRRNPLGELTAKRAVAGGLRHFGRYQEAFEAQHEVFQDTLDRLGPAESATLAAQHDLGVGLRLLGRYEEAYELDTQTLARREHAFGGRHISTLDSGNAVTHGLRLLGRHQAALTRQEYFVRLHTQVLGEQHPQTLEARFQLALCLRHSDARGPDVAASLAELLTQLEQAYGREHHRTLSCRTAYGNCLRESGDPGRARDLIVEAESGYRSLLGPAHPVTTGMLSNTGVVMLAMGERTEALALFEAALAGLTATLGADHPTTLGCALNTANARNANDRVAEAHRLSADTCDRARSVLGVEHPLTLLCQVALAADLRATDERKHAEKLEEAALTTLIRTLGTQHPHTLTARRRTRPYWDYEAYVG